MIGPTTLCDSEEPRTIGPGHWIISPNDRPSKGGKPCNAGVHYGYIKRGGIKMGSLVATITGLNWTPLSLQSLGNYYRIERWVSESVVGLPRAFWSLFCGYFSKRKACGLLGGLGL